jgi:small-conductance mechanosensitive channel
MSQLVLAQTDSGSGFNILQSLQSAFTTFVNYLPQLLGALIVLLVGFIIAKLIDKAITKGLQKAKVDQKLTSGGGGRYVEKLAPQGSPSKLVGLVVFWVIMLFVISSAIGTLGIPALTGFMNQVLAYLPNVIAALLIFIVAAAIAGLIGGLAHRTMGDTPTGKIVRAAVPALIMGIAVFMILTQLGIAPVIVTITYIALIGSTALAMALAFGLGGRDAAAELISSGYRKAQEQTGQVKQDMQTGQERATRDAQHARQAAEGQVDQDTDPRYRTEQYPTEVHPQDGHSTTGSYRP